MIVHPDGSRCRLADATPKKLHSVILAKKQISDTITEMEVYAPLVAASALPGQFVVVCQNEKAERIPLTISDIFPQRGSVSIIFQAVGRSTIELSRMNAGEEIMSVAGPMGQPSVIERFGRVAVIGGGVGTAIAYPVARAMKASGNHVTVIVGARNKDLFILTDELRGFADELVLITDDGSSGKKGFVTDALRELLEKTAFQRVLCIGPLPMMKAVSDLTKQYSIPTVASLDPIMIDGTGMCGGCRVTVGGEARYTCVDGPEFDAHLVDWDELNNRTAFYFEEEKRQRDIALKGQ